ncbi:thermonuclease family protein [Neobacillus cucumis]|uniref:thermonuclease family protein n=1 Tax=Neobacillus cucumis TaxID=1740721 RepID=UPI0019655E8C|nr:thermonuclease family protein [Neobacillus cucumis]MBM7651259.1 endonuclease YncB(thermonuclease family) [Neobacillus cucumis]
MRKRIAGVSFITIATILSIPTMTVHHDEIKQVESQQQDIVQTSSESRFSIPSDQVPISLVDTIDGDTIKVKVNGKRETVRYLLIDTPDSKKPDMCVQPYAREAYVRNNELVKSGSLTMEREQENLRDSHGRLLAYVYVDGKSVQETMLMEGFARVGYILKPPYKYLDLYRDDESLARRNKLNIWSRTNFVTRWGFSGCVQY